MATTSPTRDRLTWISYAQVGLYGAWIYGFGAAAALLRDEQGTTPTVAALHGTMLAVGMLIASLFSARIMGMLGRGAALRLGSAICVIGILGFTSGAQVGVTLVAAAVASAGFALLVTGIYAFLSTYQGAAAPAALTEANGIGAFGGLIAAFGVGVAVAIGLGWRTLFWVTALCFVAIELWRGRRLQAFNTGEAVHSVGRVRDLSARFWWSCLVLIPAAGVEFCVALWSADLLRVQGGLGSAAAAASVACAGGGVLVGRLVGARITERVDPEKVLAVSYAASGVAFMLMWSVTSAALMLVFLFVTGAMLAMHWPLSIGRSIRSVNPELADRAAGTGNVVAALAVGGAPFALGALYQGLGGDVSALRTAFLIVPAMAIFGTIMVLVRRIPA
jgi:fucose permease